GANFPPRLSEPTGPRLRASNRCGRTCRSPRQRRPETPGNRQEVENQQPARTQQSLPGWQVDRTSAATPTRSPDAAGRGRVRGAGPRTFPPLRVLRTAEHVGRATGAGCPFEPRHDWRAARLNPPTSILILPMSLVKSDAQLALSAFRPWSAHEKAPAS